MKKRKMPNIKVGDLIAYNAAGMRYKTLGLVLGVEKDNVPFRRNGSHEGDDILTVMWAVVGEYMPRREYFVSGILRENIQSGAIHRHRIGTWFTVVGYEG